MINATLSTTIRSAAFSLMMLAGTCTYAQTVSTTTSSLGTVSEISPETLVIRGETDTAPVRYRFSKTTTYVDETGAPVSLETVRSGAPVRVQYIRDGDDLVASRVIVRRTTTAPAVIERNTTITQPPVVVERPVVVEKKVYVDRPVAVEKPVIVEKAAPAAEIIEKKTTTTTTTTTGR